MKKFLIILATVTIFTSVSASASAVNDVFVKSEMYIWNRVADFLEMFRGGIAVGPSVGMEVAFTQNIALGAHYSNETGVDFPHFFPPLWVVPVLDESEVFNYHKGAYTTYVYGPRSTRFKSTLKNDVKFAADENDIQFQAGLLITHVALTIKTEEVADFFAGLLTIDLKDDDRKIDKTSTREPMRQLGRGISNLFLGIREIPNSIGQVNRTDGDVAAITFGLFRGIGRFLTREAVGVLEVVTFPMGWGPIIEPEFAWGKNAGTEWRVNEPDFMKRY